MLKGTYIIETRHLATINTDPQRRCYNGCHFNSETIWSDWKILEIGLKECKLIDRMTFWTELNDYAVSQRGDSAKREFRSRYINEDDQT